MKSYLTYTKVGSEKGGERRGGQGRGGEGEKENTNSNISYKPDDEKKPSLQLLQTFKR